jgi:hypothetical protein
MNKEGRILKRPSYIYWYFQHCPTKKEVKEEVKY